VPKLGTIEVYRLQETAVDRTVSGVLQKIEHDDAHHAQDLLSLLQRHGGRPLPVAGLVKGVGWILGGLVVISGILSFMLTPGAWVRTHGFLAGLLNPSFIPSVLARTAAAFGLAGLYALLTASRLRDTALKEKVARYAGRWVLPMALVLPVAIVLYLGAAFLSGIPLGEPLGGPGGGIGGIWFRVVCSTRCRAHHSGYVTRVRPVVHWPAFPGMPMRPDRPGPDADGRHYLLNALRHATPA
jgi:hypothetical protein